MKPMKTPGVYIVEKSAFPNSVVQVATAVPTFIGYTETAMNGNKTLHNKPWRITSMAEFHNYFGGAAQPKFSMKLREDPTAGDFTLEGTKASDKDPLYPASLTVGDGANRKIYDFTQEGEAYALYGAMRAFFQNGGGPCYIVSIGSYDDPIDANQMISGIKLLVKEPEPTMLVIPETTRLSRANAVKVQQQMLNHCGNVMRNRFAILDVYAGYLDRAKGDPVATFRNDIGINFLDYGAAYYPWVHTSIYQARDFTYENITDDSRDAFVALLKKSIAQPLDQIDYVKTQPAPEPGAVSTSVTQPVTIPVVTPDNDADPATVTLDGADDGSDGRVKTVESVGVWTADAASGAITFTPDDDFAGPTAELKYSAKTMAGEDIEPANITVTMEEPVPPADIIDKTLRAVVPLYTEVTNVLAERMNCMPPAALMAGIYTMVDSNRGVWKAPANVSLNSVTAPTVNIDHDEQEDLNVTPQGKSINAIRPFVGEGTLVWGARTLDGNSLDWRYINVRRTMIMLEESIRLASKAYVFEPNTANTWVTMRSMIENFLTGIWKQGGLAGAVPEDAFSVHVGLGETMTPVDILEGILRITVLVAVVRPAEFIEITFQQQLQKS